MKIALFLIASLFFSPVFSAAEERNDKTSRDSLDRQSVNETGPRRMNPFLTLEEEKNFGSEIIESMFLSAIFYSFDKPCYAIIDGRVLKLSDVIDGKEVASIKREEVILKDNYGKEYIVRMAQPQKQINHEAE